MAKKTTTKDLKKRIKSTRASLQEHRALIEQLQSSVADITAQLEQTQQRLNDVEASKDITTENQGDASEQPDETWTVAQLKAEAKAREVTGYSAMTKAELLSSLT